MLSLYRHYLMATAYVNFPFRSHGFLTNSLTHNNGIFREHPENCRARYSHQLLRHRAARVPL